jgi:colanic acid/amylovoran biosynthesis glycosyltransferase
MPLLRASRSYDAIVAHFGPEGVVADALRQMTLLRGPLVTFFHGYDLTLAPRSVGHGMYRSLFRNGDRFLAICNHGARKLLDLGADPSRTQVHHMGVNVERFRPREDRPCGSASLRVLSVGRLIAKKGFDIGIDTVAAVLHSGVSVDYRIIGEGPQRDALAGRIRAGGLEQSVHLLGPVGEEAVVEALRDTDVLLAPSISAPDGDHEGIPMVLMEAMASGVPVVATAHGGIPELVRHGESGLLVQERDSVAAAEALRMLALNPETRLRIGQQCRARVAIDFNADLQNARLERLLEDLVARTPGQ